MKNIALLYSPTQIGGNYSCTYRHTNNLSELCVKDTTGPYKTRKACTRSKECLTNWEHVNELNLLTSLNINKYLIEYPTKHNVFNIKYSDEDKEYIDKLQITDTRDYTHYGNKDEIIIPKLDSYLVTIGPNSPQVLDGIKSIIFKLIDTIVSGYKTEYFWLDIRCTLPTNNYDIPRWHCDGPWLTQNGQKQTKFVTILKGPGTLLMIDSKKIRKKFIKIHKQQASEKRGKDPRAQYEITQKYRPKFATELAKGSRIQLANDQGLIFTGTDGTDQYINNCSIHSEPVKDRPRFFISIVPGTQEQIQERIKMQREFDTKFKNP